jgi:hypothetical protein
MAERKLNNQEITSEISVREIKKKNRRISAL